MTVGQLLAQDDVLQRSGHPKTLVSSDFRESVAFITDTFGEKQRDRCGRSRESGPVDEF